ncbi:helix-turn-helix domain-containing protein, partial [Blautia sp.]|uniref:helix-turn-helix domain-containing protein n=1 Tax=Blautia sp. TaxID=1955243 RepID=UPI003FA4A8B4
MRKINRAVKIRIYPNAEQRVQIEKTIGCSRFQTVDKLGVGCYAQHHFSFKTSFLFIFFKINKNLAVFQSRFSRIFASF